MSGSQNLGFPIREMRYTINEKVPPTASNRRKRELAREEDLVTYKIKRKTIDPSTVVPPNTADSANEGVSEGVNIPTESAVGINIPQGSEFETESAQAGLGAQPPLPNVCPNFDENIPILGGYSEGEGATNSDDVGPRDKSLLRRFRFHRARSIALGQDLNTFKSLKAGGAGNSLSLKKLKEYYAYKLEKVLNDGTAAAAKKKKGLTARPVARVYMLKPAGVNEHGDTPVHQYEDIAEQYDASHYEHSSLSPNINLNDHLQKLKEDKENESEANINLRKALKEKTSECDLLKETIEQMKAEIELKRVVDEQCVLEFADLPRQLDTKILECKNLEKKNKSLEAELRSKSGLEDCNQSLFVKLNKKCKEIESLKAVNTILMEQIDMQLPPTTTLTVLQSHQTVPDTTLAKKYEDLLAAHENVKKKLIAK
ncbi:hypothetical protein GIB67_025133 [Kingdonia uniflora]|uniref:Uncharacterized protein n=1 Tax=Kingdonia uniflora TaxID=39325 RepID=A0A7J7N7R9_9MAGN|nr:hypothetical protein GIB67_025133 [Kingdonia uniflora]